jgi:hypothetical protein
MIEVLCDVMLCSGYVVLDASMDHNAFIFWVKQSDDPS